MKAPVKGSIWLIWLVPVLLFFSCSNAQNAEQAVEDAVQVELPKWTWPVLQDQNFKEKYRFNYQINPFYLQADFDNDNYLDMAILIIDRSSSKSGLLILRQNQKQPEIFGAGQSSGFGTEDWSWLQTWKIEAILPAGIGLQPAGAVLILFPKDKNQNAPWLFWQNKQWQWKTD